MVMLKRGQFFLLSAVIISVVVLSLSVTVNRAIVSEDPDSFYDFSYEVEREIGAVVNYDIYHTGVGDRLVPFINKLAEDIKDNNPDADFMFVYEAEGNITVRSYVNVGEAAGRICINGPCYNLSGGTTYSEYSQVVNVGDTEVEVEFKNTKLSVPILGRSSVAFIMQRDVGDEKFVVFR
ncbi:MAG TPA: DUF645 family protein [Candidatus Pacearchaeota archaeon]|nr:DUF645 family protein [Candidatus Pacearchaeota archaeon]